MTTVPALLTASAIMNCQPTQIDITNAFFELFILEEVYMKPPFDLQHPSGFVCWALYGLKQVSWGWVTRFSEAICSIGYTQGNSDSSYSIAIQCLGVSYCSIC